jgi:hypothetical protein
MRELEPARQPSPSRRDLLKASGVSAAGISLVVSLSLSMSLVASAVSFSLPHPGTPQQVAILVTKSLKISQLPTALVPPLSRLALDTATNTSLRAPTVCKSITRACTFGNIHSSKLVVLFGDSHAWMWINAVNPIVVKQGYRLQLLAYPGCPVAKISIWAPPISAKFTACDKWRASMIQVIKKESPSLVILSERTSQLFANSSTLVSSSQITSALASTIRSLQSIRTKVAVIGDVPTFTNLASPITCLAIHVTSEQKCSTPQINPHAEWRSHSSAERLAAVQTATTFIDPTEWMCSRSTCSEIIGNFAVYFNGSHVSATFAAYLSTVIGMKIAVLLKRA